MTSGMILIGKSVIIIRELKVEARRDGEPLLLLLYEVTMNQRAMSWYRVSNLTNTRCSSCCFVVLLPRNSASELQLLQRVFSKDAYEATHKYTQIAGNKNLKNASI